MQFIRIADDVIPVDLVESVAVNNDSVTITLTGVPGNFNYTGSYAQQALRELTASGQFVYISGDVIPTVSIEWANLAASFDGQPGVEVRLSTDAPDTTRQYTGAFADQARSALIGLTGGSTAAAVL